MKKIVGLVLLVTMLASMSITAIATETQNECDVCHSTGIYRCTGNAKCPSGTLCPSCLEFSFGYQPKCSKCGGSGKQNLMGQKVTCSNCLGKGESILEYKDGVCGTCHVSSVCSDCFGVKDIVCPHCQIEKFEEFAYNKVMREDPDGKIGNLYIVSGYVVETEEIIGDTILLSVEIPVNEKTSITCNVVYKPIQDLKLLIGDEVRLYAQLVDVDEKDSLPTFFASRAELAE